MFHYNFSASIFATKIKNGCQVAKKRAVDPLIKQWIFSNRKLYVTSLIQCLYNGGEKSFHLHRTSLLARSEQKETICVWALLKLPLRGVTPNIAMDINEATSCPNIVEKVLNIKSQK